MRQLRRNRVLQELLLPGREVVNRQHDIGVLADGLVASAVQDDVLDRASNYLATSAILAASWTPGERNELAIALSAALLRDGWTEPSIEELFEAIAKLAINKQ